MYGESCVTAFSQRFKPIFIIIRDVYRWQCLCWLRKDTVSNHSLIQSLSIFSSIIRLFISCVVFLFCFFPRSSTPYPGLNLVASTCLYHITGFSSVYFRMTCYTSVRRLSSSLVALCLRANLALRLQWSNSVVITNILPKQKIVINSCK